MIATKPRVKDATVDSCFELVGSRQDGVATRSTMFNQRKVSCLLNARGNNSGWALIQMFTNVRAMMSLPCYVFHAISALLTSVSYMYIIHLRQTCIMGAVACMFISG